MTTTRNDQRNRSLACAFALAAVALIAPTLMGRPAVAAGVTEQTLYSFKGGSDGGDPGGPLIMDASGALYGTASGGVSRGSGGTVFKLTPPVTPGGDWTKSVLYSFCSLANCADGGGPVGGLIFDAAGTLYGTTTFGGSSICQPAPANTSCNTGTVYKLTPPVTAGGAWTESVLYSFTGGGGGGSSSTDGGVPFGGLTFDAAGALYGTTGQGGGFCRPLPMGCGTVFKLIPPTISGGAWTESVLYTFTGGSDGFRPVAGLIMDAAGALYGTTTLGGNLRSCGGCGTVFKLTPPAISGGAWTESVLYSFTAAPDGALPEGGVITDAAGALYGTTMSGGTNLIGTVFKLTPPAAIGGAWSESVLYSFIGGTDGLEPQAGLISDINGALYGTTSSGGTGTSCFLGCGTVYKLTPPAAEGGAWTESVLYSFTGGSDGGDPVAGLIFDASGDLYGTASGVVGNGYGAAFELTGLAATPASPLLAAVLPASRSIQVGTTATAFATIINSGATTAPGCTIAPIGSLPLTFHYQTTDPTTNQVTGTTDTPVAIAGQASQSFVIALTPNAAFNPLDLGFMFGCANVTPAPSHVGLNTLLLSASTSPVPDVVALAATAQNDGIVHVTGSPSQGAFAVATVNLGVGAAITASANTGAASLPLTINLCQTNPTTGQCISAIGSTVTTTIGAGATPTFAILVSADGTVAFDPANSRITVQFADSGGAVRGETSVAVRTQ